MIHTDHKILMSNIELQEKQKKIVLEKPTFETHFRAYMQGILAPSKTTDMLDVAQAFAIALNKTHINRCVKVYGWGSMEFEFLGHVKIAMHQTVHEALQGFIKDVDHSVEVPEETEHAKNVKNMKY